MHIQHSPLLAIVLVFCLHMHATQSQTESDLNATFAPNVTDDIEISSTMLYTTDLDVSTDSPTVEPTNSPTLTTTTTILTTDLDTTDAPKFTLVATLALSLQDNNATVQQLRDIIREVVEEQLDEDAFIVSISAPQFVAVDDADTVRRRRRLLAAYTAEFEVVIGVDDEDNAVVLAQTLESDEFKQELATVVRDEYGGTVTVTASSAVISSTGDDDGESPVIWQPWTYGDSLIHWILFGLVCVVLLVCLVLLVYGCCKCRRATAERRRSRYQAGDVLFTPAKKDQKHETAFNSDLNNAIQMHNRSSWLKKSSSKKGPATKSTSNNSLDLNETDVNTAFDMNFDEVGSSKNSGKHTTTATAAAAASDGGDAKTGSATQAQAAGDTQKEAAATKKSRKLSEKSESDTTPGGPDAIDEDDEENVPPPPQPPVKVHDMNDEDLL